MYQHLTRAREYQTSRRGASSADHAVALASRAFDLSYPAAATVTAKACRLRSTTLDTDGQPVRLPASDEEIDDSIVKSRVHRRDEPKSQVDEIGLRMHPGVVVERSWKNAGATGRKGCSPKTAERP